MSKKMYNEQLKWEFINSIPTESTKVKAKTVFYSSFKVEQEYNKDVIFFTKEELIHLFEQMSWTSQNVFSGNKNIIARYITFCSQKKIISNDAYQNIVSLKSAEVNNTASCLNKYYKNFNEVVTALNKIFNSETDYNLLRMKCICGLLWYGVPVSDVTTLTSANINQDSNTIQCASIKKKVSVPRYIIDWCNILSNTLTYTSANGKEYVLKGGDQIIKTKCIEGYEEKENADIRCLQNLFRTFVKTTGQKLSEMTEEQRKEIHYKRLIIDNLQCNGRFEKAYKIEKTNSSFKNSTEYGDAVYNNAVRSTADREYGVYLSWKRAYNL